MIYIHTNYFIVISDVSYISVLNITSISLLGIMLQKRTEPHHVLARPASLIDSRDESEMTLMT